MYQRREAPFRVPATSLHFKESGAMMTTIWVLKEVMCLTESPLPSNEDSHGDLKPSGTGAFQISTDNGWGSGSSSSP